MKKGKNFFEKEKVVVPFFRPHISNEDKKVVQNALKSHILTNGPIIEQFEKKFTEFTKSPYSVAVSNATAALHLALNAAGIKKGDEVIIPDITFAATANVVLMVGATPVLVDVNNNDCNINLNSIKESINNKTKAIISVHFAGKACQINQIMKIAKKSKLIVIEDCAHAIGTRVGKIHVGTFGDMGCFSFYPTKNITTLEGGMLITKKEKFAEKVKAARNHGINRTLKERYAGESPWEYDISSLGYNYRLDEIRSALGISQLKRIESINFERQKSYRYYCENLCEIEGISIPDLDDLENNSCHLFIIKIDEKKFGKHRNFVFKKLLEMGISTSLHYKPLHLFTIFKKNAKTYSKLRNSNELYDKILSLPFYFGITKKDQDAVIKALIKIKNS